MEFRPSESELNWAKDLLKAFLMSNFSGQVVVHCSQGRVLKVDRINSLRYDQNRAALSAFSEFLDEGSEGDSFTLTKKSDNRLNGQRSSSLKNAGN